MTDHVDLYNTTYGHAQLNVYAEIRRETYGLDLGQTSWISEKEIAAIPGLLKIAAQSNVLEIGCGAGGCALHFAATIGCRVTGIDVNAHGLRAAAHSADEQKLAHRAQFLQHNAAADLPFPDASFDAIYSNDAFCHIPERPHLLGECRRVLREGGRMLYSDALVISGPVTNEEFATRSSIGYYLFLPLGENERLIRESGLHVAQAQDCTAQAADISQRWHHARAKRRDALVQVEGELNFEGLQRFLSCVHNLTAEGRLSRFLYVALK